MERGDVMASLNARPRLTPPQWRALDILAAECAYEGAGVRRADATRAHATAVRGLVELGLVRQVPLAPHLGGVGLALTEHGAAARAARGELRRAGEHYVTADGRYRVEPNHAHARGTHDWRREGWAALDARTGREVLVRPTLGALREALANGERY
jgi:hypothetical protein